MKSQVDGLRELLELAPQAPTPPSSRREKQRQTRLAPQQLVAFADAYRAGAIIEDLATEFRINRVTVMRLADRLGLPRRTPILGPEEVEEARRLYQAGQSLLTVGEHLGVAAHTVSLALRKAGVEIRDRRGWP